jgi:enoyl-CoA hydratase/carnithine racemase
LAVDPSYEHLAIAEHDHVVEVVLSRVAAHNALSTAMAAEIADVTGALAANPQVRAVVVSSAAPKAFCVGADLKERNSYSDDDLRRQRPIFRAAFGGIFALPMPSVAAVHGYALGGGLELALACDLIVADESAVLGLPEVTVGVIPGGGGTQLLAPRVGYGRAADLIFTGRRVDAAEAAAMNLVDRIVPVGRAREEALALAAMIAANSPVGVRNAKRALRAAASAHPLIGFDVEDAAWRATAFSGDRREGVAAFNEKRPPAWPGE